MLNPYQHHIKCTNQSRLEKQVSNTKEIKDYEHDWWILFLTFSYIVIHHRMPSSYRGSIKEDTVKHQDSCYLYLAVQNPVIERQYIRSSSPTSFPYISTFVTWNRYSTIRSFALMWHTKLSFSNQRVSFRLLVNRIFTNESTFDGGSL